MHIKEPRNCKSIQDVRDAIDVIDREILRLFAKRLDYVKEIVKYKKNNEESIVARERKEQVLQQRENWAKELKLDEEMIEQIFRIVIDKNIQIQIELSESEKNKKS